MVSPFLNISVFIDIDSIQERLVSLLTITLSQRHLGINMILPSILTLNPFERASMTVPTVPVTNKEFVSRIESVMVNYFRDNQVTDLSITKLMGTHMAPLHTIKHEHISAGKILREHLARKRYRI